MSASDRGVFSFRSRSGSLTCLGRVPSDASVEKSGAAIFTLEPGLRLDRNGNGAQTPTHFAGGVGSLASAISADQYCCDASPSCAPGLLRPRTPTSSRRPSLLGCCVRARLTSRSRCAPGLLRLRTPSSMNTNSGRKWISKKRMRTTRRSSAAMSSSPHSRASLASSMLTWSRRQKPAMTRLFNLQLPALLGSRVARAPTSLLALARLVPSISLTFEALAVASAHAFVTWAAAFARAHLTAEPCFSVFLLLRLIKVSRSVTSWSPSALVACIAFTVCNCLGTCG